MKISVMITTRNRCQDLARTLQVLDAMSPPPDEILVTADGCEDGTARMVRERHPHCRLFENSPGTGSVLSRDLMLRNASGELVMSLDDDSYPAAADFFARLPEIFDQHPEAAVITFPEMRDGGVFWPPDKTPESTGHYVSAYPNGAAAMRRDTYLSTDGYPAFFYHAYEEPDYALQCHDRGMAVWFEPGLVVRHHYSEVNRDPLRTHQLNARNELWSVWLRCPWPWLPLVSLFRIWRQFRFALSQGFSWVLREPLWWWQAAQGLWHCLERRQPVPWDVYFAWMKLARSFITDREEMRRFTGQIASHEVSHSAASPR